MRKVNLAVIRPWIVNKVVELVGFEDEVVVEYAMGLLEDDSQPVNLYLCSNICSMTNVSLDSRPQEDANQPDRFPDQRHASIHGCAMDAPPRSSRLPSWSTEVNGGSQKRRDAPSKSWRHSCVGRTRQAGASR